MKTGCVTSYFWNCVLAPVEYELLTYFIIKQKRTDISEWDLIITFYRCLFIDIQERDLNHRRYCHEVLTHMYGHTHTSHTTFYNTLYDGLYNTYGVDLDQFGLIWIQNN